MTSDLPTLHEAKREAKALCAARLVDGVTITHGAALEQVAHRYGFRDWNTCHAAIASQRPRSFVAGGRVRGHYLAQPFEGTVLASQELRPGWFRLQLDFDTAVDVVAFDSFSNFRKRVTGTVGPSGVSRECTSDGRPQLEIEL